MFPRSICLFCCRKICGPILGIYNTLTDTMNVEIKTETAQFPEKEYINEIFVAVCLELPLARPKAGYALSPSMSTKEGLITIGVLSYKKLVLLFSRQFEEKTAEPEAQKHLSAFEGFSSTIKSFSALAW